MTATDLPPDPLTNRSEGMRCRTCLWFVSKGDGLSDVGRCRRHAPAMNGYPVVLQSDWCGDHRLNERVRAVDLTRSQSKDHFPEVPPPAEQEVARQIAIDLVVRQNIDGLLNAGCTLQKARELLNRELDWRHSS